MEAPSVVFWLSSHSPTVLIKLKSLLKGNIGENDLEITECGFLYSINKTLLESKALGDKDVIKVPVEQTSGEVKVQLEAAFGNFQIVFSDIPFQYGAFAFNVILRYYLDLHFRGNPSGFCIFFTTSCQPDKAQDGDGSYESFHIV